MPHLPSTYIFVITNSTDKSCRSLSGQEVDDRWVNKFNVWFLDEAYFLLSGHVNTKNNTFWGNTSPEHCLQRPLHSMKCTAWVAISERGIIGPFWFEDDNVPNVPAAPGSSFGAHFLSASETKSFYSTDLKLWRYLLHRLDLMQLTFCVNLNKFLEVIRFLVMTFFLCYPVLHSNAKPCHDFLS